MIHDMAQMDDRCCYALLGICLFNKLGRVLTFVSVAAGYEQDGDWRTADNKVASLKHSIQIQFIF